MLARQITLDGIEYPFPSTRYQGSKNKLVDWIWYNIQDIEFDTVLDAFSGTSSVSHMLKCKGKSVSCNDMLKFNYIIGKALIENNDVVLEKGEVDWILEKHTEIYYPSFIQDNFKNVFYLDQENQWLDIVVTNIKRMDNEYKQALAWFALFQSCIIKRPYNLFHRANLYVRTSDVERSFGNKTTWDTSFEKHFRQFAFEANEAVFDNGKKCDSNNYDAFEYPDSRKYDLVYIDTPYLSSSGVGTDYLDFYHFLEGMLDYENWGNNILDKYKHLPLKGKGISPWTKKEKIYEAFEKLFNKFKDSVIIVSYRADGIPSENEMLNMLKKYKSEIIEAKSKDYKYALAHNQTREVLFIAK